MTDPAAPYRYWAFISYSSKDAPVARQLHRRLEAYRIPRDLAGRPGRDGPVPRKLFPVFRDREELPLASDLGSSIEDALRSSRYLIVLCSPDAARSRWVNEEIRYFKALGREDRMLAILLSGEPNASDKPETAAQECFPPALRHRIDPHTGQVTDERIEPIAGDLRPGGDGWNNAFLKAVAGITGLGFDAFVRRERKRRRRRMIAASAAGLMLVAGGAWTWDYNRLKVADYLEDTTRWSAPEGIFPIAHTVPRGHPYFYRFESRRNRVRRVLYLDRGGHLHDNDSERGAAVTEVFYREDGSVGQIDLRSRSGKLVMRKTFSELRPSDEGLGRQVQYVDYRRENQDAPLTLGAESAMLGRTAPDSTGRSEITAEQRTYDASGRLITVVNLNAYHQKRADVAGTFGFHYEYQGASASPSAVESLGYDGKPTANRVGLLRAERTQGPAGAWTEERYFGAQGRPIAPQGFHRLRETFDAQADTMTSAVFGTDDRPVNGPYGYHELRQTLDPRGGGNDLSYFGVDGKAVYANDGTHRVKQTFDREGNLLQVAYFGTEDQPVYSRDGYHYATQVFDKRGNPVQVSFFGTDGRPTYNRLHYHRVTQTFDDHGNVTQDAYFGAAGEPVTLRPDDDDIAHYHRAQRTFDKDDNQVEVAYFDTQDKPFAATGQGYSRVSQEFDERGNLIAWSYYDGATPAAAADSGYHRATQTFDARGNLAEGAYFGIDGAPVVNAVQGFHRYKYAFDERGRAFERTTFGPDGTASLDRNGYYRTVQVLDEHGNPLVTDFFGINGEPVPARDGCHRQSVTFDQTGRPLTQTCFGLANEPVVNQSRYHLIKVDYDDARNQNSEAYFGLDDEPVNSLLGYHRLVRTFDARGNFTDEAYFGADERPMLNYDRFYRMKRIYDNRGFTVANEFFGIDGEPVLARQGFHRLALKYDARGDIVEMAYFGVQGEPILRPEGYCRTTNTVDANGEVQDILYFDLEGRQVTPHY